MITNFTDNHQLSTRLTLNYNNMDILEGMTILETTINNNLEWT